MTAASTEVARAATETQLPEQEKMLTSISPVPGPESFLLKLRQEGLSSGLTGSTATDRTSRSYTGTDMFLPIRLGRRRSKPRNPWKDSIRAGPGSMTQTTISRPSALSDPAQNRETPPPAPGTRRKRRKGKPRFFPGRIGFLSCGMLCYDFRITPLCNGSTSGFGPLSPGSNPGGVAICSFPLPEGFPGFIFSIFSMMTRQGICRGQGTHTSPFPDVLRRRGIRRKRFPQACIGKQAPPAECASDRRHRH